MASITAEAKRKLAEIKSLIQSEVLILSERQGENSRLLSDNESLRSQKVNLSTDVTHLILEVSNRHAEIRALDEIIKSKNIQVCGADEKEKFSNSSREQHENKQTNLIRENAALESTKSDRLKEINGYDELIRTLEDKVRLTNSQDVVAQEELRCSRAATVSATVLKEKIMAAIDRALEQFRVFERRIGQLSQETGYTISWDDPKELLDKK